MDLGQLQLWWSWVGAGQQGSGGFATFSSAFLQPYQAVFMFFQCFTQIRGGRSPRAMEGRARLCKEPCTACSGALPGAWRPMLSLHAPLHCGSSSTGALSWPIALCKNSREGQHHGRLLLFFFLIHFLPFITKIVLGPNAAPGKQSVWAACATEGWWSAAAPLAQSRSKERLNR